MYYNWVINICLFFPLFFRKAHLILRRVDRISLLCRSLLRSGYIQSRTESMPYVMCRNEDMRLASSTWHSSLHETRLTCVEKILSVQRNIYGKSKLRWRNLFTFQTCTTLIWSVFWTHLKCKTVQPFHQTKDLFFAMSPLWLVFQHGGGGEGGSLEIEELLLFTFFFKDLTEEGLNVRSSLHGAANFTQQEDDESNTFHMCL